MIGIGALIASFTCNHLLESAHLSDEMALKLADHYSYIPLPRDLLAKYMNSLTADYMREFQGAFSGVMHQVMIYSAVSIATGSFIAIVK
jgi:hypothetical protein